MLTINDLDKIYLPQSSHQIVPSQWAIVLGCDTAAAQKRAQMAVNFFQNGGATKFVFSGGVLRNCNGAMVAECHIMRNLFVQSCPNAVAIAEDRAQDTVQNMVASLLEICQNDLILNVNDVTIITEGYHLPRALLLARLFLPQKIRVHGYTTDTAEEAKSDVKLVQTELYLLNLIESCTGQSCLQLLQEN